MSKESRWKVVARSWNPLRKEQPGMFGKSMFSKSMFGKSKQPPQQVINGRFEIERDGHVAYLEYNLTGKILQLIHSEVPEMLRGQGMSAALAQSALEWARAHAVKVDVICPSVAAYLEKHPEYSDLLLR